MKRLIFGATLAVFCLACQNKKQDVESVVENEAQVPEAVKSEAHTFDWLIGTWQRINDKDGNKTFERWRKVNENQYKGHGYVMNGQDTVWEERMIFYREDRNWQMGINTPGNKDIVNFHLTQEDENSFVVENPNHDFPKIIKYWIDGPILNASVEGGEKVLNYAFTKN